MADLTLYSANRNYSSWSLRAYLVVERCGAAYDEVVIPLGQPDSAARIHAVSAAGRMPVLKHGDLTIWDSLAICEYLNELHPDAGLWPADSAAWAVARSVSAEMHSGFMGLRTHLPLNLRAHKPRPVHAEVVDEVARIRAIWRDCRQRYGEGGQFLFGGFGIADAMFAPVVGRFRTYGVPVDGVEAAYAEAIWALPAMQARLEAARAEPWTVEYYEV